MPFLVLGLPIFDICFAVIRRVAKGQSPMHADRGHVHHRLIDMGFSQKQAVAISYLLSAILGLAAVVLTDHGEIQAMIFLLTIVIVGAIGIGMIFGKHHPKKPEDGAEYTPKPLRSADKSEALEKTETTEAPKAAETQEDPEDEA